MKLLPCSSILSLSRNYKIDFSPPNIIPLTNDMIKEEFNEVFKEYSDTFFKLPYLYNLKDPFILKIYDIKQELVTKDKVELDIHSHAFYYRVGNEDEKSIAREMIRSIIEGTKTWGDLYIISDDSRQGSRTMVEEETKV